MDISPDHITGMGDTLMMLKVRRVQNDDFDALFLHVLLFEVECQKFDILVHNFSLW